MPRQHSCYLPLALGPCEKLPIPPLGLLFHFWGKIEKKKSLQFSAKPKPLFYSKLLPLELNASLLNRYSLWTTSGRWQHCSGKFLPETQRVFHISLFTDQKGQEPIISVIYICGSNSFCYDLLPSRRSVLKIDADEYMVMEGELSLGGEP